ncbi:hypothetical protein [Cupriavidus pampae]|uniref:hypothetical protein n=1 Tax=Cupriavidus pampae TaxID=659251 RepID=UPI001CC37D6A|nr:hypothetical protein [Cupriavidus pampae]
MTLISKVIAIADQKQLRSCEHLTQERFVSRDCGLPLRQRINFRIDLALQGLLCVVQASNRVREEDIANQHDIDIVESVILT